MCQKFRQKSQFYKEKNSSRWKCFSSYESMFLSTIDELCSTSLENMKYLPTYLPTHQLLTTHLHTYQSTHSALTHPLTLIPTWLPTYKHRPYLSSYLPTYITHTYIINRYQQAHKSTRLTTFVPAYPPTYQPTFLSLWRYTPFWPMATRFPSSWIKLVNKYQDTSE